ncbi:MAG: ABC transporter substrate-binding protein [Leptospiraceae bacterium]|nr:ABC transporter substrate-binding protein [Leptospiraceae bacterium]
MKSLLFSILLFINCTDKVTSKIVEEEKILLPKKNKFKIATLEWSPYVGTEIEKYGYVYQIVKRSLEEEGIEVEIEFYPFARILNLVNTGEISGYFPEYHSVENEKNFYYSNAFPGGDLLFLKKKERQINIKTSNNKIDFQSLKEYKIGVVRGYLHTPEFDEAIKFLNIQETASDLMNLKKLFMGRVDLIEIDPNVANYLSQNSMKQFTNAANAFEVVEPKMDYKDLFLCIPRSDKNGKKLLNKFNSGFEKLKSRGEIEKILKEFNFKEGRYKGKKHGRE